MYNICPTYFKIYIHAVSHESYIYNIICSYLILYGFDFEMLIRISCYTHCTQYQCVVDDKNM